MRLNQPLVAALSAALIAGTAAHTPAPADPRRPWALEPGHGGPVAVAAFSPDGSLLASGSANEGAGGPGAVKLWDVSSGALRRTIPLTALKAPIFHVAGLAFSPDGKKLAIGGGHLYHGSVVLYDLGARTTAWEQTDIATTHFVRTAFAPDGQVLATSGNAGVDLSVTVVKLWDASTGRLRRELKGQRGGVWGPLAFAPDGRTVATAGRDGTIVLWDALTGEVRRKLRREEDERAGHGDVEAVSFSPDGKTLAGGSADKKVRLWDTASGQLVRELRNKEGRPMSLAFSPDGRRIAAGNFGEQTVRVWDVPTGEELTTAEAKGPGVVVAFSPDGRLLAVGGGDGALRLLPSP
jgi:WD40 repeat protein